MWLRRRGVIQQFLFLCNIHRRARNFLWTSVWLFADVQTLSNDSNRCTVSTGLGSCVCRVFSYFLCGLRHDGGVYKSRTMGLTAPDIIQLSYADILRLLLILFFLNRYALVHISFLIRSLSTNGSEHVPSVHTHERRLYGYCNGTQTNR